jgi:hypothetical protein
MSLWQWIGRSFDFTVKSLTHGQPCRRTGSSFNTCHLDRLHYINQRSTTKSVKNVISYSKVIHILYSKVIHISYSKVIHISCSKVIHISRSKVIHILYSKVIHILCSKVIHISSSKVIHISYSKVIHILWLLCQGKLFLYFIFRKSSLKIALFSDVMPYGLVVCYQYLGGM